LELGLLLLKGSDLRLELNVLLLLASQVAFEFVLNPLGLDLKVFPHFDALGG